MEKVLLAVDDEPNVRSTLERQLRRYGYVVFTSTSGEEGLKILDKHHIPVVLSDEKMPNMRGFEFLEIVKIKYPRCIRVMLSGQADSSEVTEGRNNGTLYDYLQKPWEEKNLVSVLESAFEHYDNKKGES